MLKIFLQKFKPFLFNIDFYLYLLLFIFIYYYLYSNQEIFYLLIQIFLFFILIVLVITDDRFSTKRKYLFFFLTLMFWIISFYINKAPMLIIKDLFWYSLVLNGSFIFHVLILSRLFNYCWKNHYEYAGFLVSRISFLCSLSGLIYIIKIIQDQSNFLFVYKSWEPEDTNYLISYYDIKITNKKLLIINLMQKFFNKYNKIENIHWKFVRYFQYFLWFILSILIYFSLLFHNYSLILMGKNKTSYTKEELIIKISFFLLLFLISIIIGISRLYIIWILVIITETYKILTFEYIPTLKKSFMKKTLYEKLKEIYEYPQELLFSSYYEKKYSELSKIYEVPYNPFFMFDLYKFLLNKYKFGYYSIWGEKNTIYENYDEKLIYPIRKVYKYYPWKEIVYGYIKVWYILQTNEEYNDYDWGLDSEELLIDESIRWMEKINLKNKSEQNQLLYEILIWVNPSWLLETDVLDYIETRIKLYYLRLKY